MGDAWEGPPGGGASDERQKERERDAFDDLIRRELAQAVGEVEDPEAVLQALGPALRQARRKQVARSVGVGAVVALALVGGVGLLSRPALTGDGQLTVAAEDGSPPNDSSDRATLVVDGSLSEGGSDAGPLDRRPAPTSATTVSDATSDPPETVTSVSTTPPAPTTGRSSSTGSTSSAPGTDVDSRCGSLTVSRAGNTVRLVEVRAAAGFSYEVKSSGPESIEVSFEDEGEDRPKCELNVKVEDGELSVKIDQE